MRYVYEHREEAAAKGRHASEVALSKWTWDAAAEKMIERLDAIDALKLT